jgi:hypothetical protein
MVPISPWKAALPPPQSVHRSLFFSVRLLRAQGLPYGSTQPLKCSTATTTLLTLVPFYQCAVTQSSRTSLLFHSALGRQHCHHHAPYTGPLFSVCGYSELRALHVVPLSPWKVALPPPHSEHRSLFVGVRLLRAQGPPCGPLSPWKVALPPPRSVHRSLVFSVRLLRAQGPPCGSTQPLDGSTATTTIRTPVPFFSVRLLKAQGPPCA